MGERAGSWRGLRPMSAEDDDRAALDLWARARAAGLGDPWPPLDRIAAELAARPYGDSGANLWADARGRPIGAALLLDESILLTCAAPDADDEALVAEMVAWGIVAAGQLARHSGDRPCLFVPVQSGDERLAAQLERAGFAEDGWRTLRMERLLRAPLAEPPAVAGVRIEPIADDATRAAAAALHRALFFDEAKSASARARLACAPGYRQAFDLAARADDGTLAGYVLGSACELERRLLAQALGWLDYLGVAPAWRGRGLGAALTLRLLQNMRAEGLESVILTTGATNGAARSLFERCGFRARREIRWYVREPARGWRGRPG